MLNFHKLLSRWLNKKASPPLDDGLKQIEVSDTVKVWGIVSGPYSAEEVGDPDLPEGLEWMLVCKVEVDGELTVAEYWFSSFEGADKWVTHFRTKIEPLEVNYG